MIRATFVLFLFLAVAYAPHPRPQVTTEWTALVETTFIGFNYNDYDDGYDGFDPTDFVLVSFMVSDVDGQRSYSENAFVSKKICNLMQSKFNFISLGWFGTI